MNRAHLTAICFAALSLTHLVPLQAQPTGASPFAAIPPLQPLEDVVGVVTLDSQLALFTTRTWYTSPFAPGPGQLTQSLYLLSQLDVSLRAETRVANNPIDPAQIVLTGGAGFSGNILYTLRVVSPPAPSSASLTLGARPVSITSDGTSVYAIAAAKLFKVDPATGAGSLLVDSTTFTATAQQVVLGPDGLLYVLDTNNATGRIAVFDTNGNFKRQFPLSQPGTFQDVGPMAISPIGQLYSLSTEISTSTLGIDTYDINSGSFLGRLSGAGTFSADQNFNPGGHAALMVNSDHLYLVTGTGASVWSFSIPTTPTISSLMSQVQGTGLSQSDKNALMDKLQAAQDSLTRGNAKAAANQLGAFINQVTAMYRSGRLSADTTASLIGAAQAIINSISH